MGQGGLAEAALPKDNQVPETLSGQFANISVACRRMTGHQACAWGWEKGGLLLTLTSLEGGMPFEGIGTAAAEEAALCHSPVTCSKADLASLMAVRRLHQASSE